MTRFITLLFAIGLVVLPVSGRTVKGLVLSDNDSTAIVGAMCVLKSADNVLASTASAENGVFELAANPKLPLTLTVSMTGYSPTEIMIAGGSKDVDLGAVYMSEGIALNEVTVSAQAVTDSRGRTIVYPTAFDVKSSATSLSLFQKLPLAGLEANPVNRTLTVDGGSPMILIDGVPSTMSDVNALKPGEIARIEFSRVTPARYADRGVSGLINITLKKRNDGGTFYGWTRSAVSTAFFDANVRASYHQGPSQFNIYYNPSWRNYQKVYDNHNQSYVGDDYKVDLEEHDRNPFNYLMNPLRFKYNYTPSTRTLVSATFNMELTSNSSRYIGYTSDSKFGDYDNRNQSSGKDVAPSLDLFLRHDFNDRNSLEAQVVGTISSNDYRRDNVYMFGDGSEESYVMNVDNRRRSLISEISYIHNFSDKTSLSGGFQNTVSHSTNTYLSSDYKPVLTENNNYVYARLGQQLGKVYVSLASGAKLFWVKNDMNKRHFVRNLTTVQASWNANQQWSLSGAFQYSPGIPSLAALTDYPQQMSPYLISNGNPNLKVAEYFVYQAMPSFRYKKFNTSLLFTYRNVHNQVISDLMYLGDGRFLSQSVNSRRYRNYGGNLNIGLKDISGFGVNVNVALFHYYSAGEGWSHHLTSLSGNMSLWWSKGPYTVSYWRKLPGKYLSGHVVGKEENGDALSISYNPDKHWTIGIDWMYMFENKGTQYPSWNYSSVNPGYNERYIKNNANMVVVSVSYSADFGSIFRTGRRSLNNSDSGSSLLKM